METQIFYFNSFLPSTIRAWNNLTVKIQQADSLRSFKSNLNLKSPPKYFYAGTRLGQILHARLRMDCISLNSHLYRKNIVESPSCTCGGSKVLITSFFNARSFHHFQKYSSHFQSQLKSDMHAELTRELTLTGQ